MDKSVAGRLSLTARVIAEQSVSIAGALLVGVGLLMLRKWVALLLCAASIGARLWLIISSIKYVPFHWLLANLVVGVLFFAPVVASYLFWLDLVWKS